MADNNHSLVFNPFQSLQILRTDLRVPLSSVEISCNTIYSFDHNFNFAILSGGENASEDKEFVFISHKVPESTEAAIFAKSLALCVLSQLHSISIRFLCAKNPFRKAVESCCPFPPLLAAIDLLGTASSFQEALKFPPWVLVIIEEFLCAYSKHMLSPILADCTALKINLVVAKLIQDGTSQLASASHSPSELFQKLPEARSMEDLFAMEAGLLSVPIARELNFTPRALIDPLSSEHTLAAVALPSGAVLCVAINSLSSSTRDVFVPMVAPELTVDTASSLVASLETAAVDGETLRDLDVACLLPAQTALLDMVFVMDCTGSMGSYIRIAQQTIRDTVQEIVAAENANVRFALVGYRDHPPQESTYVTVVYPFTSSTKIMRENLDKLSANGGGDGPEAVVDGLDEACKLTYRADATKVCLLIADAPPHGLQTSGDSFASGCPCNLDPMLVCRRMAETGITLYCIGCEPSINSTKSFFMAMSMLTGGQYCALGQASTLSSAVVSGMREEISLERVMHDTQECIAACESLDDDAKAELVVERMKQKGARTRHTHMGGAALRATCEAAHALVQCDTMDSVRAKFSTLKSAPSSRPDSMYTSEEGDVSAAQSARLVTKALARLRLPRRPSGRPPPADEVETEPERRTPVDAGVSSAGTVPSGEGMRRRLASEIPALEAEAAALGIVAIDATDVSNIAVVVRGRPGSAYASAFIALHMRIPGDYPFRAPAVSCASTVFNPQISGSRICSGLLLSSWSPSVRLTRVVEELHTILSSPDSNDAINDTAGGLHKRDRAQYDTEVAKAVALLTLEAALATWSGTWKMLSDH